MSPLYNKRIQTRCNVEERVVIKLPLRASFAESSDQYHVWYKIAQIKLRIYPALSLRHTRCPSTRFKYND